MQAFFIGLQFLTRINVVKQTVWTEEDFGKSVRFFPLVGAVLGIIYAAVAYIMYNVMPLHGIYVPVHLSRALLLVLPILLTGGIHCDGFMDTIDGIFSGRKRERMLEIMKDSCTGSFAVVAFVCLMFVQYALLLDLNPNKLYMILFIMPIISRLMMTAAITLFPYARPEGMGKAFAQYSSKRILLLVAAYTCIIIAPVGKLAAVSLIVATCFMLYFARYVTKVLGGLTGDVYGAICTLSETVVLISCMAAKYII